MGGVIGFTFAKETLKDILGINQPKIIRQNSPMREELIIDSMVANVETYNNTITNKPTSDGVIVSDHVVRQPIVLSGECLLVDSSLLSTLFPSDVDNLVGTSADEKREDLLKSFFNTAASSNPSPSLLTIQTPEAVYKNMIITSLTIVNNRTNSSSVEFSFTAQEIITVNRTSGEQLDPNVSKQLSPTSIFGDTTTSVTTLGV